MPTLPTTTSEEWRRFGEARRKYLLEQDERDGGTFFRLNHKCPIQQYFGLAQRVLVQFRELLARWEEPSQGEDAYIMGHRLLTFLSVALPQHPHYMDPKVAYWRDRSFQDLVWIQQQMDEIALRLDEAELNAYMDDNYEPSMEEEDDTTTSTLEAQQQLDWEDFGWSADFEKQGESTILQITLEHETVEEDSSSTEEYDPAMDELNRSLLEDCADYTVNDILDSEFLNRIKQEDVRYETDSEAVDSWAQDGDSSAALSSVSSGPGVTYDAARVAFHEIMNRVPFLTSQASACSEDKENQSTDDKTTVHKEACDTILEEASGPQLQELDESEDSSTDSTEVASQDTPVVTDSAGVGFQDDQASSSASSDSDRSSASSVASTESSQESSHQGSMPTVEEVSHESSASSVEDELSDLRLPDEKERFGRISLDILEHEEWVSFDAPEPFPSGVNQVTFGSA